MSGCQWEAGTWGPGSGTVPSLPLHCPWKCRPVRHLPRLGLVQPLPSLLALLRPWKQNVSAIQKSPQRRVPMASLNPEHNAFEEILSISPAGGVIRTIMSTELVFSSALCEHQAGESACKVLLLFYLGKWVFVDSFSLEILNRVYHKRSHFIHLTFHKDRLRATGFSGGRVAEGAHADKYSEGDSYFPGGCL